MKNIFSQISSSRGIFLRVLTIAGCGLYGPLAISAPPRIPMGDPVFFLGPIGQGLGGATYSLKSTHDNLLTNPSAGAFGSEYAADGAFSTVARTLGTSVFDTKSTSYGGGLTYLRREVDSDTATKPVKAGGVTQTYQNFGLSLFGKLHESFAISVTGKYSMRSGTGAVSINGESWNADVGASFRLSEKIGFGAAYKNLFGDSKDIEAGVLAGGAHIEAYPGLTFTGALEKYSQPSDTPNYGVPDEDAIAWVLGAQYRHESGIAVRGAYRDAGPWDTTMIFGGIGYDTQGFHVNYTYGTVSKGDKFASHTFGLGATF